jgi:glucokinase
MFEAVRVTSGTSMRDGAACCGLGIDLGGSSAKLGLVSGSGEVQAEDLVIVPAVAEAGTVLAPICAAVDRLKAAALARGLRIAGLGCGVPGFLDPSRKQVLFNNVAALDNFPLAAWLQDRCGLPVSLDNDACMAALAESSCDSMRGAQRVLVVTVGTGIGVVLVAEGAIVRVHHGTTGEAGHLLVNPRSQERCPLGCRGCLETVASAPAIARAGRQAADDGSAPALAAILAAKHEVSAADVSAAAAAGDQAATAIIQEAGAWLGAGLASWAPVYAPDLVLLGGGVAQAGAAWFTAATRAMTETGWPFFVESVAVRPAALGHRAGMIGAALAALRAMPADEKGA